MEKTSEGIQHVVETAYNIFKLEISEIKNIAFTIVALTTYITNTAIIIYDTNIALSIYVTRKEGNVLFNDAVNTFYLWLYGVRYMLKDHTDSKRGNPLLPHGLLFLISSKGSFICIIPQIG